MPQAPQKTGQRGKVFLISKYFILITVAMLLVCMSLQAFNSTTTLYVVSLGGKASSAGLMLTCFTVAATLMRFSGKVVDRLGCIKIIVAGGLIFAAGAAMFFFGSIPLLFPARFIQGVGYSLATTGIGVAIASVIPRPRMNEGIGYHGLAQTLAMALGPTVALTLCNDGAGPFSMTFMFAVIALLLVTVVTPFLRYDRDEAFLSRKREAEALFPEDGRNISAAEEANEKPVSGVWNVLEKTALPVMLPNFLISLTTAATVAFLTLYATSVGIANISLFYLLNASATVIARFALGRTLNKWRVTVCTTVGFCINGTGFLLLMLSSKVQPLFYISGIFIGVGQCFISPTLNAEVIRRAPAHRRGVAVGTFLMIIDIGIGAGAYFWGLVLDLTHSYTVLFGSCVLCCVLGLLSALLLLRQPKKT